MDCVITMGVIAGMVGLALLLSLGPSRLVRTVGATYRLWRDALLA